MSGPGYIYLVSRETDEGAWMKVGVAARIGRVRDHVGWTMHVRTFETDCVLANARSVEQAILRRFPDVGPRSSVCGKCGAQKPPVGRTGTDGLTEVRHARCHADLPRVFEEVWKAADRLPRDAAWRVSFDPLSLRPGGFFPLGEPWRQPPRMNANEYQANTCNVLCVRGVPQDEVVAVIDRAWEAGAVDLRSALFDRFGVQISKMDGTPSPRAKGSGASGELSDVEGKLARMARLPDVEIVLVSVRKPGMLYAYVKRPVDRDGLR